MTITWFFSVFICYCYKETILFKIIQSTHNISMSNTLTHYFIFTDVSEIFYVYLKLIIFVSNQILLLVFFYHLLMFLSFGLYTKEYLRFRNFLIFFLVSLIISFLFLFNVLLPFTWNFFVHFYENNNSSVNFVSFFFEAKIIEYLFFFTGLYYVCFFSSQILLITLLFINYFSIELVSVYKFRKLFYLVFVCFSTFITPPDVLSQLFLSFCFIMVYELLILLRCLSNVFNKEAS